MDSKYYLKSVGNAFKVINILSEQQGGLTINELVNLSGLNRASINRIVFTLLQIEYLMKFGKKYYLSDIFMQIGATYRSITDIGQRIKNEMTLISDKFGESTYLYGNIDDQCVLIDYYCPPKASFVRNQMLDVMPYNCSTIGKIFLSEFEDDAIRIFMDKVGFFRSTELSICQIDEFLHEIENARTNGYALCKGEYALDSGAVGIPIYSDAKRIQYVISLAFDKKMTEERLKLIIDDMLVTSKRLSQLLSYQRGY